MYRDISVLLVEDDELIAMAADAKLSAKHFRVLRAPDKITALKLINEADILILDLNLPNGNGKDVLQIWSRKLDVGPAMVITGCLVTDDEIPEAWSILRKPFKIDLLVDVAERYAQVVRGMRCCKEVGILKKRMTLMWIAIAALGGIELIGPLAKFVIGLI